MFKNKCYCAETYNNIMFKCVYYNIFIYQTGNIIGTVINFFTKLAIDSNLFILFTIGHTVFIICIMVIMVAMLQRTSSKNVSYSPIVDLEYGLHNNDNYNNNDNNFKSAYNTIFAPYKYRYQSPITIIFFLSGIIYGLILTAFFEPDTNFVYFVLCVCVYCICAPIVLLILFIISYVLSYVGNYRYAKITAKYKMT